MSDPITRQDPDSSQGPCSPVYATQAAHAGHPDTGGGDNTIAAHAAACAGSSSESLTYPPGFARVLAQSIYQNSYTPIREVSITAALALLAGVCGRGFRTHTGKDLALYIVLVARSGIGKDGIHDGIPALISLAGSVGPNRILRQEDFASGPALHKALLMEPGFLNLQGEFGRKLKGMANPGNLPMQELRTVMTKAYGSAFLEGKAYSKAEDCLQGVPFPALSFLGETTPGTFLESLSSDMMEDGFLSRFLTVHYNGERPLPNVERFLFLPDDCLAYWRALLKHSVRFISRIDCPDPVTVNFKNYDACEKLEKFERECITAINASTDESVRQMYNRAHLKALKIAGILAVADNFYEPLIHLGHATWGITTVRRDIQSFQQHERSGNIGNDDHARSQKVIAILREYVRNGAPASYGVTKSMQENSIAPWGFLQRRTSTLPLFRNYPRGAVEALRQTVRTLCDGGYLMEVQKDKLVEHYRCHAKAYRIIDLPPVDA